MGDPALALADLGGHQVEALGQPTDLVLALDGHMAVLAALQTAHRLVQGRDRLGHAARQAPAAQHHQDQPRQACEPDGGQQGAIGGEGAADRIGEQQRRLVLAGQAGQGFHQGDGGPIGRVQGARLADLVGHGPGHEAVERAAARHAPQAPVRPGVAVDHVGVERNGREALQRLHLLGVHAGGEHHPADEVRRQDRRRHHLVGRAVQHEDPLRRVGIVERAHQGLGVRGQLVGVGRGDLAVDADDEGLVHLEPGAQVLHGRDDGGLVAGGHRRAEAEVTGQQRRALAQLVGPQRPHPIEHRARGDEFAAHLALGGAGDRRIDRNRDQDQGDAEQAGIEHGELGPQVAGHGHLSERGADHAQ